MSTSAERSRRWRRRRRAGVIFVGFDVEGAIIDFLIDMGRLGEVDDMKATEIAKAIKEELTELATRHAAIESGGL